MFGICISPGLMAPTNLMAMVLSSSSIMVMWDAIDCPTVSGYMVVHNSGGGNITRNLTESTTAEVTDLPAFAEITVFVAAISDMEVDGPASVVVETTLLQGEQHGL